MSLQFQPVRVATNSDDEEGQLVLVDGVLVALLVRLSELHEKDAGRWFLETVFGRVEHALPPTFANLGEAQTWIADQIAVGIQAET